MTQGELFQELKSIGLPIQYHHFTDPPAPPYLVYLFAYSNDLMADNFNYQEVSSFQIELYTKAKDLINEQKIQDKLKELKMPFSKVEEWIETEKLYQVVYEIQLIGG